MVNCNHVSSDSNTIIEKHTDSINVGKRGHNKLQIQQIKTDSSTTVEFSLFSKVNNEWIITQTHSNQKDPISSLDIQFQDFNNDGLIDFTYRNGITARGSNELRQLFIFSDSTQKMIELKNSTKYPNIRYNSELDCLDSYYVYNGSTTVFLKIQSDSLKIMTGFSSYNGIRTFFIQDKNGKTVTVFKDSIPKEDELIRYDNYVKIVKARKGI